MTDTRPIVVSNLSNTRVAVEPIRARRDADLAFPFYKNSGILGATIAIINLKIARRARAYELF